MRWLERSLRQAGVSVIARSTSPEHGLALAQEHCPDLLVIGSERPLDETSFLEGLVRLRRSLPELRTVVVSRCRRESTIAAAFDSGVDVYCLRSTKSDDFAAAARQALDRSIFLPLAAAPHPASAPRPQAAGDPDHILTRREREILALVSGGRTNREVARLLWLTEQTVKFHLRNVYRKLGVPNRVEAARWAHRHHLLDGGSVPDRPAPVVTPGPIVTARPVACRPVSPPRRPARRRSTRRLECSPGRARGL
ncbi:MAG TPA: response regulator transcription factor [Gaiellaceae bacterium]|nr:response regulator transcription factor [Gaiellaceae bacterium]